MRILFVTPHPPDPAGGGAAIRNWHLIRAARAAGHIVTVYTFADAREGGSGRGSVHAFPPPPERATNARVRDLLLRAEPDLALRLRAQAMTTEIARTILPRGILDTPYDIVQVEGLEMWPNLPMHRRFNGALNTPRLPLTIYDAHNAEATLQGRAARHALRQRDFPAAAYSLVQWLKLRAYEQRVVRAAAVTLAVSPDDASALEQLAGCPVAVVPIGVDTARYNPVARDMTEAIPFDVLFSGTLDYRPNADAALWLVREIWPRVRAARPTATLALVGRNPLPALLAYDGRDGISVTGAVPDDRPYMAGATVYALPIRFGAGVRLKLLNALSMGCAVVATPAARAGVEAAHGRHLVVAPARTVAFAAAIVALLNDAPRRISLGTAARALMTAHYDWSVVTPALLRVYEQLNQYGG